MRFMRRRSSSEETPFNTDAVVALICLPPVELSHEFAVSGAGGVEFVFAVPQLLSQLSGELLEFGDVSA